MEIFPIQPIRIATLKAKESNLQSTAQVAALETGVPGNRQNEIFEDALSVFAAITPRQLREIAAESFERDEIDENTFRELSAELPTHAVDRNGNVTDLSNLTDETQFDYAEYYRTQQSLAQMIGDMDMAESYTKVLDFFARTS